MIRDYGSRKSMETILYTFSVFSPRKEEWIPSRKFYNTLEEVEKVKKDFFSFDSNLNPRFLQGYIFRSVIVIKDYLGEEKIREEIDSCIYLNLSNTLH